MPPRGRKGPGKKPSPRTKAASPVAVVEEKTVLDSESLPTIVDDETPMTGDVSVDKAEAAASAASAETVEERNDTVEEKTEIFDEKNEIPDEKTEVVVETTETTETVVETVVIKEVEETTVTQTSEPLEVSSMDPLITEKGEDVAEEPEAITDGLEGPNSEPLIEDDDEAVEDAEEILDGTVGPTLEPANEENEDEDPEEIEEAMDGEDRNEAFPMEQDQAISGANQEIGVGEVQGTEGGGTDVAGPSEDGGKSASDDEEDEQNEEEDEAALCMQAPLSERKKQKEFEIFVGGLDKEAVEEDLVKVFGQFGEIQSARIVKHQTTQKSKGFAFIRYTTVEQAKKALIELKDGVEVRGKRVGISASQENDTLYMGNICKTWTKDQILETLKGYGIEQLEEIYLPEDPKIEGNSKGFALLEFSTHSDAMAAFQRLRKPDAVFGCDRSAKVSFAQSSMHPSFEALSQVKTVFVEGLPNSWNEQKVNEHCKQYGEIEKIQLSRNFTTARRKDFGFISFTSRESAVACVEGINTAQIGEGEVKVKANLAKPQNKGRLAKQGARGGFRVKNEGESTDGAHLNKPKGHTKFKGVGAKGKGPMSMRTGRGGQPLRPHGRGSGAQGGAPFHDPQRRKQQFKGGKPGGRGGPSNYNARPANKGRGNMHGRPNIDTGKNRNSRFGKPKGNYPSRPAPYRESYAPGYGAPATGYQGRGYGASSGSKRQYSDMDPHAGYHGPAAKQGRDSYGYGQRSAGGYNNHANTTAAGYSGGSVAQPSYGTDYSNYPGYEQAGYAYPSGSGAYPPNSGAYPPNTGAYPPNAGAYPPNSGAYPPNAGAYPPNSGTYPPSDTGVYPPSSGAYPPSDGGAYPPHGQYY